MWSRNWDKVRKICDNKNIGNRQVEKHSRSGLLGVFMSIFDHFWHLLGRNTKKFSINMPGSKRKKVSAVPQKKYIKRSKFPLEDLPNEVLLKVFSYLQIHDLFYCGHVNQRIRLLTRDEKLWQKISISRVYLY